MSRDGNRATELGQFESGQGDFDLHRSGLAPASPVHEVAVRTETGSLTILPVTLPATFHRSQLVHTESDLLGAQLTEDPAMTSFSIPNVGNVEAAPSRMQKALARNSNREQLIWYGIDGQHMEAAMGNRIIVRRDAIESEYSCYACRGKGHSEDKCPQCDGKQNRTGMDGNPVPCSHCRVLGYGNETPRPSGYQKCRHCFGSGWTNGVIVPEVSQAAPVTGTVVSLGPLCEWLKLGDRVLHSKFSGHTLENKQSRECFTHMMEKEVISLLRDINA